MTNERITSHRRCLSSIVITVLCGSTAWSGEADNSAFPCIQSESAPGARPRPIVLVELHPYHDVDWIHERLRQVARAEPGGPDDVSVILTGVLHGDERSIAYMEHRVGESTNGRLYGLEDEDVYSVASLTPILVAVSSSLMERGGAVSEVEGMDLWVNPTGEVFDMTRRRVPLDGIRRAALRGLYVQGSIAEAWKRLERPTVQLPKVDAAHVADIERVFDRVVAAAEDPDAALPAPDDPDFDAVVVEPNRAGMEDRLAFVCVLRALLRELVPGAEATSAGIGPQGYRPDLAALRAYVENEFLMPHRRGGRILQDIVVEWRHHGALEHIARVYCVEAPHRPVELVVSVGESKHLAQLLRELLGPDFPLEVKRIQDLR